MCPTLTKPNYNNKYSADSEVVHSETAKIDLVAEDRFCSSNVSKETFCVHVLTCSFSTISFDCWKCWCMSPWMEHGERRSGTGMEYNFLNLYEPCTCHLNSTLSAAVCVCVCLCLSSLSLTAAVCLFSIIFLNFYFCFGVGFFFKVLSEKDRTVVQETYFLLMCMIVLWNAVVGAVFRGVFSTITSALLHALYFTPLLGDQL